VEEQMMDIQKNRSIFKKLYGYDDYVLKSQQKRYDKLSNDFTTHFGIQTPQLFSTPGRTEIGGNHTDHNHGRVLAASVNVDSIAAAAKNNSDKITLFSEGYAEPFEVKLDDLSAQESEQGTTAALVRGIATRVQQLQYKIGGFEAYVTSDVLPGSGLSSSASIEVLLGTIFNALFNEGKIPPETIAMIGQFAENVYFGKPCGLMDQMTCAVGGIVSIDFKNPQMPLVKKVDFDFSVRDYRLLVVNTGGSHADLTDDYAAVPAEMKAVAKFFGNEVCREINYGEFISRIKEMRPKVGDRAILRALHFIQDNERVLQQVEALEADKFELFLELVKASGNSSFKWLQNSYSTKDVSEQGVSLALALTEKYISEIQAGACRVHGGGFAGTIQVFLPTFAVPKYIDQMEAVFGENSVLVLTIRQAGTMVISH
jgi:galactokinase